MVRNRMIYCTSNEISVAPSFASLVEILVALNTELQAGDTACQARDALANNNTENCRYARGWQTVHANCGRPASAYRAIIELAQENDVVIVTHRGHVKLFDQQVDCVVWSAQQITSYTVPITHDVDTVWVDDASTLSSQVIDNIYMTYAGKAQQFVFVG